MISMPFGWRRAILGSMLACASFIGTYDMGYAQPVSGDGASGRMTDGQIVGDLGSYLDKRTAEDTFSGAVLLAKNGTVLFEHAYGYADHAFDVPNRVDTKFNLGSMGKMFTGVAILQLAQAGKLSLDDKLIKDLPDYPNKEVAGKVTLRQLLTHTAGLGDFFGPEFMDSSMARFDTLESLLPLFVNKPLLFEPGTRWAYSNAGFVVLGLVIQHVSGQSYYDYVREHVFGPAGMVNTGNWPADADIPNRAVGYTDMGQPRGAPRKSNIFMLQRGGAAGGGYSTVEDLLHFAEALEGHKLLNAKYTAMAMTGYVATPRPGVKYGFGMEESSVNGVRIVGHGGGGPGIQSILDIYPDQGYVVAIMTNYDDAMSPVDERLRMELTGQPQQQPVALTEDALKPLAGQYAPTIPPGMKVMGTPPPITVTVEQGGLKVDPGMGPAFHFLPQSADEFYDKDSPNLRITFVTEQGGRVTALQTATGFGPVPPLTATKLP